MLEQMGQSAREASWHLAQLSTEQKNQALLVMADLLEQQEASILAANEKDRQAAREANINAAMLDRLLLNSARLKAIADDVRQVCR
jgi:glutamate-5-semialdehyde dehydrogenase